MAMHLKQTAKSLLRAALAKKMFLTVVLAVVLTASAATVYANETSWWGSIYDDYGHATGEIFLSCGSSAGDHFFICDHNGNCVDGDHSTFAAWACGN